MHSVKDGDGIPCTICNRALTLEDKLTNDIYDVISDYLALLLLFLI